MRADDDLRSLLRSVGGAALGIGLGVGILVFGYVVSRVALPDNVIDASSVVAPTIAPGAPGATRPSSSASAPATPSPTATTRPTTTPDPLVVTGFQGQGLRLAGLMMPSGYTLGSPITGTVTIVLYQFVSGEIRTGANADAPTYPYVFIRSATQEIKLRPGAIDRDVQLLVKDGDTVTPGTPILSTVSTGASSWHVFYDANVNAQVVASVTAQPAGTEIDPVPVFKR